MKTDTVSSISDGLDNYWNQFVDYLPQLVSALVVLVIGLVVASVIAAIVKRLLAWGEDNKQVREFLKRWNIKVALSGFVSKFAWWVIFLVFVSAAVQILDVPVLTNTINQIVAYTPLLFAAAVVAGLTFVAAKVVRGLVESALSGVGFSSVRLIGGVVYTVLVVFGLTLAAAQLNLDTTLITANITVVIAGVALAAALAFGLGGRGIAGSLVAGIGARELVKKGQKLSVDGVSGKVVKVTATAVVLETANGECVVPYSRMMK